jgi:hypothetical protein
MTPPELPGKPRLGDWVQLVIHETQTRDHAMPAGSLGKVTWVCSAWEHTPQIVVEWQSGGHACVLTWGHDEWLVLDTPDVW